MVPPEMATHVLAFIRDRIDSVPELEALLLLAGQEGRRWNAREIAARIYVRDDKAASILANLQRRRLASEARGHPGEFVFSPLDESERALVGEVGNAYRANLIAMATLIHAKAPASVREFARAFDLKKEH